MTHSSTAADVNRGGPRRWYVPAALGLAAAAAVALPIDVPLARWALEHRLPGDLRKLVTLAEVFAHGMGVGLILAAVFVLDRRSRPAIPRLITASLGAGLLANVVKSFVARTRPLASDLQAGVGQTFHGFLPWLRPEDAEPAWNHALQSFPSGHTATAVGLAVALTWLYPHGRWLFLLLATLAGIQRMESGSHYLSDTLAAAALACVWAGGCLEPSGLGRWFDRWEQRTGSRVKNLSAGSPFAKVNARAVKRPGALSR